MASLFTRVPSNQHRTSLYIKPYETVQRISASASGNLSRPLSFVKKQKLLSSLDYWTKHNPMIMAEEMLFESRGVWKHRYDFLVSCFTFGLGLGNFWRFPYMVVKHGGSAFLIAYLILMILIGAPIFFIDLCISQFSSQSIVGVWTLSPGFVGIGYSMLIVSSFYSLYYNLVLGWIFFYLINSLRLEIPYITCNNEWNDYMCKNTSMITDRNASFRLESPAEQHWYRFVIKIISEKGQLINTIDTLPTELVWYTCSCLLFAWGISCSLLMRSVRLSGGRVYLLIILLVCILIVILILSAYLPNSYYGFILLFTTNYEELINPITWINAGQQLCFSLGIGFGGTLCLSSYNNFENPIDRFVWINCLINFLISLLNTIAIYMIIGFLIHSTNLNTKDLSKFANEGILFILYPECISNYKYSQMIGIILFTLLFVMGLDSFFVVINTVLSGFIDIFPSLNLTKYHKICFILILHIIGGTASLILVTNPGFFWLEVIELATTSTSLIVIQIAEILVIGWVYGIKNMERDYKIMTKQDMNSFWKISIVFVAPIILIALVICDLIFVYRTELILNTKKIIMPFWVVIIEISLFVITIIPIPGWFIYKLYYKYSVKHLPFKIALQKTINCDIRWGPSKKSNWLLNDYFSRRLLILRKINKKFDDQMAWGSQSIGNQTRWLKKKLASKISEESDDIIELENYINDKNFSISMGSGSDFLDPLDINYDYVLLSTPESFGTTDKSN